MFSNWLHFTIRHLHRKVIFTTKIFLTTFSQITRNYNLFYFSRAIQRQVYKKQYIKEILLQLKDYICQCLQSYVVCVPLLFIGVRNVCPPQIYARMLLYNLRIQDRLRSNKTRYPKKKTGSVLYTLRKCLLRVQLR